MDDEIAALLAAEGGGEGGGGKKKKKKKKKAKKPAASAAAKKDEKKKGGGKQSARAKVIAEKQKRMREEREAAEAAAAVEAARFAEEEKRAQAAAAADAAKRKAKKERARLKKEAEIAAGTYMTKKQRDAHEQRLRRVEGLQRAQGSAAGGDAGGSPPAERKKTFKKKFKKQRGPKHMRKQVQTEEVKPPTPPPAAAAEDDGDDDDWEAESDGDDGETAEVAAPAKKSAAKPAAKTAAAADDDDGSDDWEDSDEDGGAVLQLSEDEEDEAEVEARERQALEKARAADAKKRRAERAEAARKQKAEDQAEDGAAGGGRRKKQSWHSRGPKSALTKEEQAKLKSIEASRRRRRRNKRLAMEARSEERLRCPIVCVMGHVDVGKTKLLDKMRHTNVQDGEAGGITQQIGATYFPQETLLAQMAKLHDEFDLECRVPGLLMIDTPGHESFNNLRSRGSNLCDIAILVVDIMHGLEPQTLESLQMLRDSKTPFMVALNKVDRCYDWKPHDDTPIRATLAEQEEHTISEFMSRVDVRFVARCHMHVSPPPLTILPLLFLPPPSPPLLFVRSSLAQGIKTEFMEQGLNSALYFENEDMGATVSLVPTSAHSGEGISDLLVLLIQLTQTKLAQKLMWCAELECRVLEVKCIEGLGTTVDAVLLNGTLRTSDTIVLCGMHGAIVTPVRALLTPEPLRELRVKGEYRRHEVLEGAIGVKIAANDVDRCVAGTRLMVLEAEDDIDHIKEEVMKDLENIDMLLSRDARGVFVQASTIGSLEALIGFLRAQDPPIPVAAFGLGPVHKKEIMQASIALEHDREYATVLAFNVDVTREAREMADETGVKIFTAEIIYHLFDHFSAYVKDIQDSRRASAAEIAVFPVELEILPQCVSFVSLVAPPVHPRRLLTAVSPHIQSFPPPGTSSTRRTRSSLALRCGQVF